MIGETGSIAFSDDFRGDIFLIFLTPKDEERVASFHLLDLFFFRAFLFDIQFNQCYML